MIAAGVAVAVIVRHDNRNQYAERYQDDPACAVLVATHRHNLCVEGGIGVWLLRVEVCR